MQLFAKLRDQKYLMLLNQTQIKTNLMAFYITPLNVRMVIYMYIFQS